MRVCELEGYFDELLPRAMSCEWDNDGLMVSGDSSKEVKSALLTLDLTEQAIDKAIETGVDAVITHHPFVFRAISSITDKDARTRLMIKLIEHKISVYSYHTKLDAARGGVNDILCEIIGLSEATPLGPGELSMARIGNVEDIDIDKFAAIIKEKLACPVLTLAKAQQGPNNVRRVAVLGGACDKDTINAAKDAGADVLVSGDVSYNNVIDANIDGLHIICAGHYFSEKPVLRWFEQKLNEKGIETYSFDCGYFEYI